MPSYKFAPKSVNFSLKNQIANILSLQGIYIQSVTTTRLYCYYCSLKQHMNTWAWLCSNKSTGNEPTHHSLPTNDLSDQIWKQSHTSSSLIILLISVEFPLLVLTLAVIYGHLLSFVGLARNLSCYRSFPRSTFDFIDFTEIFFQLFYPFSISSPFAPIFPISFSVFWYLTCSSFSSFLWWKP